MDSILSAPELWIGLGLMLVVFVVLGNGSGERKKREARLARMTRRGAKAATSPTAQSLRRKKPGEETAFGQMLLSMGSISKLQARLEIAGITQTTPQRFLSIVAGITVVVTLLLKIALGKPLLLCLLVGILLGLGLPHLVVSRKINKRKLTFLKLFPDAIDLMVRGLRAGLPIGESFITVSKEIPPPVGDCFASISQMTQLGMPMEKALADTASKLSITEFDFFVTTVILQRETGGNLGEILHNLSDMLRQRHMMKLKIRAISSEARASAYIIGSLPFLVFCILYVMSPDYIQPLFDDYRGNKALIGAGISLGIGAFIMKRMTQMEI